MWPFHIKDFQHRGKRADCYQVICHEVQVLVLREEGDPCAALAYHADIIVTVAYGGDVADADAITGRKLPYHVRLAVFVAALALLRP